MAANVPSLAPASDLLADLNPAQRAAVTANDGPLLIFAGAGSGKTRVLTHRIAWLIQQGRARPGEILAVTFTNKAAREMRGRLDHLLKVSAASIWMGTFHSIAARILRWDGGALEINRHFVIYDETDRLSAIKRVMGELHIDEKRFPRSSIVEVISRAKDELLLPPDFARTVDTPLERIAAQVYPKYEALLIQSGALDFDDLLFRTVELFTQHAGVLERYQRRFRYVMVDEYQDTNRAQYVMVQLLAAQHRNLCVVGDDDQSIYGFRGADVRNILSFERDYPQAQVVTLEQNYRSTQAILDVAYHVIRGNPNRAEKRLWTERSGGSRVVVAQTYDEGEEAQAVAREALRLVSQGDCQLADIAVLYRTNAQSRALEEVLLRRGIPYKLIGGPRFYERREVKDVIAYLRLVANPEDSISFARVINVPRRGLGEKSLAQLAFFAESHGLTPWAALSRVGEMTGLSAGATRGFQEFRDAIGELQRLSREHGLADLIDLLVARTGYEGYVRDASPDAEERWANVLELRGLASEYDGRPPGDGLQAFLEEAALMSDVDTLDERAQGVTLITIHMVKGLEFGVVFILGLEEGLFPFRRSMETPGGLEEERRLAYVGMTRAKDRLYLFHAHRRHLYGSATLNVPSRFLREIPPELVERAPGLPSGVADDVAPAQAVEAAKPAAAVTLGQRFAAGDIVEHRSWGRGTVLKSTLTRSDEELIVRFERVGMKIVAVSLAPLVRV